MQQYIAIDHRINLTVLGLLFILLIVFWILLKKRIKPIQTSFILFLFAWIPVSNLIPLHANISDFAIYYSDHLFYYPSLGLCLFLSYLFNELQLFQYFKKALLIFTVLLFSIQTQKNSQIWSDPEKLYNEIINNNPANSGGYLNLGIHYHRKQQPYKALKTYLKFYSILLSHESVDPGLMAKCLTNMGYSYYKCKDYNNAILSYQKSLEFFPDNYLAFKGIGLSYIKLGDEHLASKYLNKALQKNPDDKHLNNLLNQPKDLCIKKP